jgi:hypothetical protein
LENAEDVDDTLLGNFAGSASANAGDDDDQPTTPPESPDKVPSPDDDPMTDSAAHALAAIGLDQLLNW